jgi:capsular exopolysaccharide synthesis family protein
MKVGNPADVLVVATEPRSPTAEAYRQLRTNLQYSGVDSELKTVLITSANAAEGKSTTAANLATALAQSGKKVILVDADMRRPTLHTLLGVDGSRGLSNLIVSGRLDPSFVKSTLIPNLNLLPAGRIPPNPAEFLGSERMKEVLSWLRGQAHYLIIDSPPLLAVTDGAILSQLCDTMILVASANQTRYGTLAAAVKQIHALDSHIAGVVVNKVNLGSLQSYYYYYYQQEYSSADANSRKSLRERLQAFGISIFG